MGAAPEASSPLPEGPPAFSTIIPWVGVGCHRIGAGARLVNPLRSQSLASGFPSFLGDNPPSPQFGHPVTLHHGG